MNSIRPLEYSFAETTRNLGQKAWLRCELRHLVCHEEPGGKKIFVRCQWRLEFLGIRVLEHPPEAMEMIDLGKDLWAYACCRSEMQPRLCKTMPDRRAHHCLSIHNKSKLRFSRLRYNNPRWRPFLLPGYDTPFQLRWVWPRRFAWKRLLRRIVTETVPHWVESCHELDDNFRTSFGFSGRVWYVNT